MRTVVYNSYEFKRLLNSQQVRLRVFRSSLQSQKQRERRHLCHQRSRIEVDGQAHARMGKRSSMQAMNEVKIMKNIDS